jgi:hypothetical protein
MVRFLTLAFLATTAASVMQATIMYNAVVDCSTSPLPCVTVTLSWQNELPAIQSVEVDDSLGNFLFGLTTPSFPQTTGSIQPNPQTVSNLSEYVISAITNSHAVGTGASSLFGITGTPTAELILKDSGQHEVDGVQFIATVAPTVPEPAVWSLSGVGLVLLYLGTRIRRRGSVSLR